MESELSVEYFLRDGKVTKEKPEEAFIHRVLAKRINAEQNRYFLAVFNGGLLDPKKVSDREAKGGHGGFKQVGPEAFDLYIKYITTANSNIGIKKIERMI